MAKHLRLSSYTGSGMVIQQQLPFLLAGTYLSEKSISVKLERFPLEGKTISPLDSKYGCIFDNTVICDQTGGFSIELPPLEASFDNYTLTIIGGRETITIDDILVGEVWVNGGHSGFSACLADGLDTKKLDDQANMHYLRFLTQNSDGLSASAKGYNYNPCMETAGSKWCYGNDHEGIGNINALSWYYGKNLQQELQIPVAVIDTSMNSTFIHSWISRETIDSHAHIKQRVENYGFYRDENTWQMAGDWGCNLPGALYNHKIAPLKGLGIRGVIWHQGGSDHAYADYYLSALKNLIADWQSIFRVPADKPRSQVPGTDLAEASITGKESNGNCAWLLIQHLPAACSDDKDGFAYAYYSEAVSRIRHQIQGPIAIMPTYNACLDGNISVKKWLSKDFPVNIETLGQNLKQTAIGMIYHRKASDSAPECTGIEMVGDKLLLSFSNTAEGLRLTDSRKRLSGFAICGEDRVFHEAKARILYGVRVLVWHEQIKHPQAVSYAFSSMNNYANLINSEHIAVIPFRSDRKTARYCLPQEWTHCDSLNMLAVKERANSSDRRGCIILEQLPVWEVLTGEAVLSLDSSNKQEGDASLFVRYKKSDSEYAFEIGPCLNYGSLFPPLDTSCYDSISLEIFNPDRQMKSLSLKFVFTDYEGDEIEEKHQIVSAPQTLVGALRWQKFSFSLADSAESHAISKKLESISICLGDGKSDGSVYIDDIRFLAKLDNNV